MRKGLSAFLLILATTTAFAAPSELLKTVSPEKAQLLAEYNDSFLQRLLYFANRSRIVEVDVSMLLQESFLLTPFEGMQPLQLDRSEISKTDDRILWTGHVRIGGKHPLGPLRISAWTWDIDPNGDASFSAMNKYRHSESWEIDEWGTPVLSTPKDVEFAIAGPPPRTEEDIAHHRWLKSLKRRSIYSVSADFRSYDPIDGKKFFVLKSLEYTPKYSIFYELDPAKLFELGNDQIGAPDERSPADKQKDRDYVRFLENHPKSPRAVRGDIE